MTVTIIATTIALILGMIVGASVAICLMWERWKR